MGTLLLSVVLNDSKSRVEVNFFFDVKRAFLFHRVDLLGGAAAALRGRLSCVGLQGAAGTVLDCLSRCAIALEVYFVCVQHNAPRPL